MFPRLNIHDRSVDKTRAMKRWPLSAILRVNRFDSKRAHWRHCPVSSDRHRSLRWHSLSYFIKAVSEIFKFQFKRQRACYSTQQTAAKDEEAATLPLDGLFHGPVLRFTDNIPLGFWCVEICWTFDESSFPAGRWLHFTASLI